MPGRADQKPRQAILIVDDDPQILELLQEAITHLGHRSSTALDGLDALEKMEEKQFDIVITDLKMPRLDGLELIKRIKSSYQDVDVIAVTIYRSEYKYTDVIALGASDFISKPFNLNELEAKINRIIRERNLRTELKRLSARDGLTGLFNRRCFDENLEHEAVRALRQRYDLFLFLIDVDRFKEYNDKYGHQRGDDVLRELSRIILANIRKDVDSAYRFGGDEFAVILPHTNRWQALLVAERLGAKYRERSLAFTTLSIGLGRLEGSLDTLDKDLGSLISKADQALYFAKSEGGDQVAEYGEAGSGPLPGSPTSH